MRARGIVALDKCCLSSLFCFQLVTLEDGLTFRSCTIASTMTAHAYRAVLLLLLLPPLRGRHVLRYLRSPAGEERPLYADTGTSDAGPFSRVDAGGLLLPDDPEELDLHDTGESSASAFVLESGQPPAVGNNGGSEASESAGSEAGSKGTGNDETGTEATGSEISGSEKAGNDETSTEETESEKSGDDGTESERTGSEQTGSRGFGRFTGGALSLMGLEHEPCPVAPPCFCDHVSFVTHMRRAVCGQVGLHH